MKRVKYKRRKNVSDKYVPQYKSEYSKSYHKKLTLKRLSSFVIVFAFIFSFGAKYLSLDLFNKMIENTPVKKYALAFENFAKKGLGKVSDFGEKGSKFVSGYLKSGEKKDEKVFALEINSDAQGKEQSKEKKEPLKVFSPSLPCTGEISSPFGEREHPLSGQDSFHNGIDIKGETGDPVKATEDGKVTKSTYNQYSGNFIVITHTDGYTSSYAHLAKSNVKEGQTVKKGDIIGLIGSTGSATGPHLHFEIRKDKDPKDPLELIAG